MLEDEWLKWKFRRGSREALARIYEKYLDSMLTLAMGLLNNASEAQDIVHDVFVSFAKSSTIPLDQAIFFITTHSGNRCPLRNPCDAPVCATVQNLKRASDKIFSIRVTTGTYGNFGEWRHPFFVRIPATRHVIGGDV